MVNLLIKEVRGVFLWFANYLFVAEGEVEKTWPLLDSDATKVIFDNVRNFTIASVVAQIGAYAWTVNAKSWAFYIAKTISIFFYVAALLLFLLNLMHGDYLLEKAEIRSKRVKRFLTTTYWSVYFVVVMIACLYKVMVL